MYTRGQTLQEIIHDTNYILQETIVFSKRIVNIIYGPVFKTEFVLIMNNAGNNGDFASGTPPNK